MIKKLFISKLPLVLLMIFANGEMSGMSTAPRRLLPTIQRTGLRSFFAAPKPGLGSLARRPAAVKLMQPKRGFASPFGLYKHQPTLAQPLFTKTRDYKGQQQYDQKNNSDKTEWNISWLGLGPVAAWARDKWYGFDQITLDNINDPNKNKGLLHSAKKNSIKSPIRKLSELRKSNIKTS